MPAREWQMVAAKVVGKTEVRLVLSRIANAEELAKIDPDTGLQEDVGPSLNRYLTLSAQRHFSHGSLRASWLQADARDRQDGTPVPELPEPSSMVLGPTIAFPSV